MLRHIATATAVLALLAGTGAAASAATLGLAVDAGFEEAGAAAWPAADALGVDLVRVDVAWPAVAPAAPASPRSPDARGYAWDEIDRRTRAAAAANRPFSLALAGTPDWARAPQGARQPPGDPAWMPRRQAWRNFAFAVAKRYSGAFDPDGTGPLTALPRAVALEIRPEPNRRSSLRPQRLAGRLVSPGLLRLLLLDAEAEVAKVGVPDWDPAIVSGGVARDGADTTPPAVFLRALARTRTAPDAIGLRLGESGAPTGPTAAGDLGLADLPAVVAAIDAAWPARDRRIWITGYGAPAGPSTLGATEATQADAVGLLLAAADHPRVDVAVWSALTATAATPDAGLRAVGLPDSLGAERESWRRWIALRAAPAG